MTKLVILACLVATGQGLHLSPKDDNCEPVQASADAKFDGHRAGDPKNIADKFAISICRKSVDAMEGEFRITKLMNCPKTTTAKFMQKEELQSIVQEKFGPDEFLFLLEGPEVKALHVTPSMSNRDCKYVLPYKLSVPGKYHLNLVWTRENYLAMNERNHYFPPAHMDLPLGTETFMQFGSGSTEDALKTARSTGRQCNYKDAKAPLSGRWVYKGEPEKMFAKRKSRCLDFTFPEGKYIGGIVAGVKAPETFTCSTGKWLHAFVDYSKYEWIPDKCQPRRFTKEEAKRCLAKNKLLIRGDSHLRHLYSALTNYACDLPEAGKEMWSTCAGMDKRHGHSCGDLPPQAVCFTQDYIGVGQGMPKLSNATLTVVNFGQHQADGSHQQSLNDYRKGVNQYVSDLKEQLTKDNKGKIAWHETNASPFRFDWYVKSAADQRTYQRLQLFNEETTPTFQDLGVPVIASFEPTLALSLHAFDPSHYPKEILMPQVQNILGLLCDQ